MLGYSRDSSYQQTFTDTYAKVVFIKLYDRKTPLTAASASRILCRSWAIMLASKRSAMGLVSSQYALGKLLRNCPQQHHEDKYRDSLVHQ